MAIIKDRCYENIPIIICKTCGKIAQRKQVIELEDPALIKEKRKTWNKLIKPSFNIYYNDTQKRRNKRIFYAAILQTCLNKKHKLEVKFLNNGFRKAYDTLKEDEEAHGKWKEQPYIKPKKKDGINCASCNTYFREKDICTSCSRCREHCCCKVFHKVSSTNKKGD